MCSGTCLLLLHRCLCRGQGLLPGGGGGGSEGLAPSGAVVLRVCPAPKELPAAAGEGLRSQQACVPPVCRLRGCSSSAPRQPRAAAFSVVLVPDQCKAGGRVGWGSGRGHRGCRS